MAQKLIALQHNSWKQWVVINYGLENKTVKSHLVDKTYHGGQCWGTDKSLDNGAVCVRDLSLLEFSI